MISDLRLCQLAAQAYAGPWKWTSPGDTRVIRVEEDGYVVAGFEGTTLDGWAIVRDLRFAPWWHPRVGVVPSGALKGVQSVIDQILIDDGEAIRAGRFGVVGHSLGGQLAFVMAGWLVSLGYPPAFVAAFDPSRAGWWKLRHLIRKVPRAFYTWHGSDPVPKAWPMYLHPARRMTLGKRRGLLCSIADHRIAAIEASLMP